MTCLSVLVAPGILASDAILSMNAFEPLFWLGCAWLLVRIVKGGHQTLWLWFGVLAGLGLENKYSMLIFGAGLVVGLLLTPQRRLFLRPWPWIGGAIAFAIFLPNLLWNIHHHFPFLELHANIQRSGRDVALSPLAFFTEETLTLLPLILPVWLAGLWFFFFHGGTKVPRAGMGLAVRGRRHRRVEPAHLLSLPGDAAPVRGGQRRVGKLARTAALLDPKFAYGLLMLVCGAVLAPLAVPGPAGREFHRLYESAASAAAPHRNAPARATAAALCRPVRLAGDGRDRRAVLRHPAERHPRPHRHLRTELRTGRRHRRIRPALRIAAGHQRASELFPVGPRDYTGESMIVLDDDIETLSKICTTVRKVGHFTHPYSMPYQHFDIFYCQGLKPPLNLLWPRVKNWD